MRKSIKPSRINGTIQAPASKSMLQRAIAAALLTEAPTTISNITLSHDAKAAIAAIETLGASVRIDEHKRRLFIETGSKRTGTSLNCGEAGLSMRMFAPIAALWPGERTLLAEGSLMKRPVTMLEQPLQQLGVEITTKNGFPPVTVKGPLQGGETEVDGSISSQLLTGLLLALPKATKDSRLNVRNLKSKPYIDMTLKLMETFHVEVNHADYETFNIKGNQKYHLPSGEYIVEGDWSGASFLLIAGAIGGHVRVTGLDMTSCQADRKIIEVIRMAGADVTLMDTGVEVIKKTLKAFDFDATHCPDLFPPLAVLACHCRGISRITGVERLIHKESNRAAALQNEISAMGGNIRVSGNVMEIKGESLKGGIVDSHSDHRIAMALAVAALNAKEPVHINGAECVAKSYPDFFDDFSSIQSK